MKLILQALKTGRKQPVASFLSCFEASMKKNIFLDRVRIWSLLCLYSSIMHAKIVIFTHEKAYFVCLIDVERKGYTFR